MGVLLTAVLYLGPPAVQIALYIRALPFFEAAELLNYGASIALYYWMVASVVISTKIPLLQSALPHDAKIRFHILGSVGILITLIYHLLYKLLAGKLIDWVSWMLLAVPLGLLLLAVVWVPVPGLVRLREAARTRLPASWLRSYDTMKTIHGCLFLGMAPLLYLHLVGAEVFGLTGPISAVLYLGPLALAAGLYIYTKLRWTGLPRVRLLDVTDHDGVRVVRMEKPRGLRYRAGQFAYLRLDEPGVRGQEHPFSYLSTPDDPVLAFAVRDLGDFSRELGRLEPGSTARIAGSFGGFHPMVERPLAARPMVERPPVQRPSVAGPKVATPRVEGPVPQRPQGQLPPGEVAVCLIGSGIGSVPIVALVKDMVRRQDRREILCFLAVDRRAQIPELEVLCRAGRTASNLTLRILVREEDGLLYGEEYLRSQIGDPHRYSYYICCSAPVKVAVVSALKAMGVRRSRIHHESFALGLGT